MKPGRVRPAPLRHGPPPRSRHHPAAGVAALACPHCFGPLTGDEDAFRCEAGHVFDIARQGYVALLGRGARTDTGDTASMVSARVEFLGAGHYRPIAQAVAAAAARASDGTPADAVVGGHGGDPSLPVLDVGAGTGYYLTAVLDQTGAAAGLALDASKYAARRAAGDPRVISVLSDAWSALPVADGAVGTVLSVFAPRHPAEIARVLAPGGLLVAVTPEVGHLQQLRERLEMLTVDDGKADRLVQAFDGLLDPVDARRLEYDLQLDHRGVSALVGMGPTARHVSDAALAERVGQLPPVSTVTVAVTVSVLVRP